jgi:hypothetical protein
MKETSFSALLACNTSFSHNNLPKVKVTKCHYTEALAFLGTVHYSPIDVFFARFAAKVLVHLVFCKRVRSR